MFKKTEFYEIILQTKASLRGQVKVSHSVTFQAPANFDLMNYPQLAGDWFPILFDSGDSLVA